MMENILKLRPTDRQTDRQTDGRTDRQIDKESRQTDIETDRLAESFLCRALLRVLPMSNIFHISDWKFV